MRDFNELSGPWSGWSIQGPRKIEERLQLSIRNDVVTGCGSDADGDFIVQGGLNRRTNVLVLTRRYTWTTEPSQSGVGIPYTYQGKWDGQLVAGEWHERAFNSDGGPFEMWPDPEEERMELNVEHKELELTAPGPREAPRA